MKKKELELMFVILMKIKNPDHYVNEMIHIVREEMNKLDKRGKILAKQNESYNI